MLQMMGESAPDAQTDAGTVMSIETALAQSSLTRVERWNPYNLKHKVSREELQRMTPKFDWDAYFGKLSAPDFQQLNVTEPKFFEEVNQQLTVQKLPAWRAYLRWRLVNAEAPYLSSNFVRADFDFYSGYLQGVKEMPARWKKCTRLIDRTLGEALGEVFVAKTFSPQTKADAVKVTQQIEDEMERDIKGLQWMSDATKQQALQKLHAILNNVGYPDR
jgi:putative endopeptidase